MTKMNGRSGRVHWLLPLAYALPFVAVLAYAVATWGPKVRDLISIVVKMAVIS